MQTHNSSERLGDLASRAGLPVVFVKLVVGATWSPGESSARKSSATALAITSAPSLGHLKYYWRRDQSSWAFSLLIPSLPQVFNSFIACSLSSLSSLSSPPQTLFLASHHWITPFASFIFLGAWGAGGHWGRWELVSEVHWFRRTHYKCFQNSENPLKVLLLWYCMYSSHFGGT